MRCTIVHPRPTAAAILTALAVAFVLAGAASAQTTDSLAIGGPGATGCQGAGSPPALTGGILASAGLDFLYDETTGVLQVKVTNTSPVTLGVPNPVITQVYFNLPHLAVTGLALLSQTGSGGATPAFDLAVDTNLLDGSNPISANCFGAFGVRLQIAGGIAGGIANEMADTLPGPPGSMVMGPVTFTFQVSGSLPGSLTAGAFARSFSKTPAGVAPVNAAAKLQGGGPGAFASGTLGSATSCQPGGWVAGSACLNGVLNIVVSGKPGCMLGFIGSKAPGPGNYFGYTIPVGVPFVLVFVEVMPESGLFVLPVTIPPVNELVGVTEHLAVVAVNPMNPSEILFSEPFTVTFCQ